MELLFICGGTAVLLFFGALFTVYMQTYSGKQA